MNERHHVLTFTQKINGVPRAWLRCTNEDAIIYEVPDAGSLTTAEQHALLRQAEAQHNPRCEAITINERHPLALSCQRMDLHPGKHQHLVEWEETDD